MKTIDISPGSQGDLCLEVICQWNGELSEQRVDVLCLIDFYTAADEHERSRNCGFKVAVNVQAFVSVLKAECADHCRNEADPAVEIGHPQIEPDMGMNAIAADHRRSSSVVLEYTSATATR